MQKVIAPNSKSSDELEILSILIKEFESKVSTTKFGQRIANIESIVPNDKVQEFLSKK